ncbi:MAG: MaoC family dehydratase [Gemmatimonadales bacterium]
MGLFFEEFAPGRDLETGWRTVTAEDIAGFSRLSGDHNPLHHSPEAARAAGFGAPIAHGVLGIAVATGLVSQAGFTRDTLIALLEVRWVFRAPITAGEDVRVRLRVAECRETSRPDRGVVRFDVVVVDRQERVLQEGVMTELIRRREPGSRD